MNTNSSSKAEDAAEIATLRQEVSSLMTTSNELTAKLWEIDRKLCDTTLKKTIKWELSAQKEALQRTLRDEAYHDKIDVLKNKIYALEMAAYGESHVLDNSPNASNRFI